MITVQRCPCGYKNCSTFHLVGIGNFTQGSGFTEEEARRIAALLNADEQIPQVDPICRVINNNQVGWTNIVETAPNITLEVGAPLYDRSSITRLAAALAGAIVRADSGAPPPPSAIESEIMRQLGERDDRLSIEALALIQRLRIAGGA
jgi:hypothetical protein